MDVVTLYLVSVTRLGFVHYGMFLYIVYVTCFRVIVLFSGYWVNRGTNMFVIFVYVILFLFLLPLPMGSILGISQPMGHSP